MLAFTSLFSRCCNLSIYLFHRPFVILVVNGCFRPDAIKRLPRRTTGSAIHLPIPLSGDRHNDSLLRQKKTHKHRNSALLCFVKPLNLFFKHRVWHSIPSFRLYEYISHMENAAIIP